MTPTFGYPVQIVHKSQRQDPGRLLIQVEILSSIPTFFPGKKVAVFHGFDAGKLNKKGQNDHFKVRGCFDLYCTQGPNTTAPFTALQKKLGYFKVVETGWPPLDQFFNGNSKPSHIDETDSRPTVLICSTFSKRLSLAPKLYEQIKHFRYNIE